MSASSTAPQNPPEATMLVQAAEAGDFGAVQALIGAGVDVNSANEHGMTALMAAAASGHLAIVSFLLESGADFKAKRYDGFDALALAVFFGHLRVVRELLGKGANLKATDRLGTSPEMWATVRGFHDIAEVLTAAETTDSAEDAPTITSAEAVAHEPKQSTGPSPEPVSAQKPVLKAHRRSSSIESSYVESTYVAKPRYHHKRKSRKLVKWLAYITADWQRLTLVTLIAMSVAGLGTVAVLSLLRVGEMPRAAEPAIITETSPPYDSHFDAQNHLQSSTRAQMASKRPENGAYAERSILIEKKRDHVKPLPKSSERVDGRHSKKVITPKHETQTSSRPAQSFGSSSVRAKSIPPTNTVRDRQDRSASAKAPPHTFPSSPSIKTQRPRRVAGSNERSRPAATSGRNTKAKVIQWP